MMGSPAQVRPEVTVRRPPLKKAGSEASSLLQEMKWKQEQRERRKDLQQELETLGRDAAASGQGDIGRMNHLKVQLATVEEYLKRSDGANALSVQESPAAVPACVQEDKDSTNLYLGSLAPSWTEEMISREFGRFGSIVSIKIMYPRTGRQMACGMSTGFVQFATRKQAEAAKYTMNGRDYFGMALRVEFSKPVAPSSAAPVLGGGPPAIAGPRPGGYPGAMYGLPTVGMPPGGCANGPHAMAAPLALPPPQDAGTEVPGRRKSKFDMAKTFSVVRPSSVNVKLLIDRTAEFVALEGWDFEKLLLDRERDNPKFSFLLCDESQEENPLHLYYRWKVFSLLQGDSVDFWRTEPFQIYVNGALWQPPPCGAAAGSEAPAIRTVDVIRARPGGAAGSADLPDNENQALDTLIEDRLGVDRSSILECMAFCLDNAAASQAIAHRICNSIMDREKELTVTQLIARLYLLSDILHNAHCAKPGAAMYRRQFQQYLPEVFKRLREICDTLSQIAAASFQDKVRQLVHVWSDWSCFSRQFTQGLESVLCHDTSADIKALQRRWELCEDLSAIERECRMRGLTCEKSREQLIYQLCHYEAYTGERVSPDDGFDPELDGDPLDEDDVRWVEEQLKLNTQRSAATVKLSSIPGEMIHSTSLTGLAGKLGERIGTGHGDTTFSKDVSDAPHKQNQQSETAVGASSTAPGSVEKGKLDPRASVQLENSQAQCQVDSRSAKEKQTGRVSDPQTEAQAKKNKRATASICSGSSSSSSSDSEPLRKKKKESKSTKKHDSKEKAAVKHSKEPKKNEFKEVMKDSKSAKEAKSAKETSAKETKTEDILKDLKGTKDKKSAKGMSGKETSTHEAKGTKEASAKDATTEETSKGSKTNKEAKNAKEPSAKETGLKETKSGKETNIGEISKESKSKHAKEAKSHKETHVKETKSVKETNDSDTKTTKETKSGSKGDKKKRKNKSCSRSRSHSRCTRRKKEK